MLDAQMKIDKRPLLGRNEKISMYICCFLFCDMTLTLTILSPLILSTDLFFLLGCEIIGYIECLSDLIGFLPLDHESDCFAAKIQELPNIKVVGSLYHIMYQ